MKRGVSMKKLVLVGTFMMIPMSMFLGSVFNHPNRTASVISSETQLGLFVSLIGNVG